MATATAKPPLVSNSTRYDLTIGGRYTAVDNGDGTYDILDVVVFAEVPAGEKRNKEHIGREWQQKAILRNHAREQEGHLPPVHLYHSDEEAVKPAHAGKLRLKNLKRITYEGKPIWATTGDILGMPGEVFSLVKKGFVPYRSVEIHNWNETEIDSLSLMPTDVPYFRIEMMTIGDVVKRFRSEVEMFSAQISPVVMAARTIKKAPAMAVLFRFEEKEMPDDKKQDQPPAADAPPIPDNKETDPEAEKKTGGGDGQFEVDGNDEVSENVDTPEAVMEEGDEQDEQDEQPPDDAAPESPEDEAGGEPDAEMADQEQGPMDQGSVLQAIKAAVDQILERIAPQPPAVEQAEPVSGFSSKEKDMPKDAPKAQAPAKGVPVTMKAEDMKAMFKAELGKVVAPLQKQNVDLKTELVALRAKDEQREKDAQLEAKFAAARDQLIKARKNVTSDVEETLRMSAGLGDEQLKKTVEMFKSSLGTDPASSEDEFEQELAGGAGTDDGGDGSSNAPGAKFMADHPGPESAKFVREQRALFNSWKKSSPGSDMSFDEWLDVNHRSNTMSQRNRV